MRRTIKTIEQANAGDIEKLLDAVLRRYAVLYPDWDLNVFSVQKSVDENEQLDAMIGMLEHFKNRP